MVDKNVIGTAKSQNKMLVKEFYFSGKKKYFRSFVSVLVFKNIQIVVVFLNCHNNRKIRVIGYIYVP